jgi:hypothetical protein
VEFRRGGRVSVPELTERALAVPVDKYSNPFHRRIGLALDLPAADSCIEDIKYF